MSDDGDPESDLTGFDTKDGDDDHPDSADSPNRRTLIRLLIGLGIGIPVAVELSTFLGLLEQSLFDSRGASPSAASDTETGRTTEPGPDVGDDLLPEEPVAVVLRDMAVLADGSPEFVMTVEVLNEGQTPIELRFRSITLESGRTIQGNGSTGRLEVGEETMITGRWQLDDRATPRQVTLVVVGFPSDGDAEVSTHRVPLGHVPVRSAETTE